VPSDEMTGANTLASTVQQIAAGLGVAVGAVALRFGAPVASAVGLDSVSGSYRVAFLIIAVVALGSVVEAARLSRTAGENIRPPRRVRARA
jgi:hypothetical protein